MARRWNQEAPKPGNPKCIVCGKPMPAEYEWTFPSAARDEHGNTRLQKSVRGKLLGYGYMANGYFCTKNCGYRWALKKLKAAADGKGD